MGCSKTTPSDILDAEHYLGMLIYPECGCYTAEWEAGRAVNGHFSFTDGLPYELKDWAYLAAKDRRTVQEIQNGFDSQTNLPCQGGTTPPGKYHTGKR